jgi:hypothetical protein
MPNSAALKAVILLSSHILARILLISQFMHPILLLLLSYQLSFLKGLQLNFER